MFQFDEEKGLWEAPHTDCSGLALEGAAVDSVYNRVEGSLTLSTCQQGQFAVFSYAGFGASAPSTAAKSKDFTTFSPCIHFNDLQHAAIFD